MNVKLLQEATSFLDPWLRFRYEREEIPGFVVVVAHKGKVVFSKAYGYADLEKKQALTTEHIFRIASHSKTFTATSIMQLAEKSKLRIDDYVADYLPWLKEHKDKRFRKVTIRQLLSHGAGIIRDGLDADYWQLDRPFPNKTEFKKAILEAKLVFETNIQMKYSNYGYTLLGLVIETVSGKPYNGYVTENIIKPLGLKNTGPEYSSRIKSRIVTGYTRADINKKRQPIANIDTRAMSPATGFYSTAEDLCKYFTAHMVGSKKLLDDESKKEMQRTQWRAKNTPDDPEYGLGLEIEYIGDRRLVGHGGGFPGQLTNSLFDPKDELVVVVLTNCIDSPVHAVYKGIFSAIDHYQKNYSGRQSKRDLKKFEGRLMNLWSVVDIVVVGQKVVATYPGLEPFNKPEELEYVDNKTLKITKTGSFYSEGELVHFTFDSNGKIKSALYSGSTMLPENVYIKHQAARKIIG